jgi:hypothetical protein
MAENLQMIHKVYYKTPSRPPQFTDVKDYTPNP